MRMAAAGGLKRRGAGTCWPWSLVYWSSAQPACGGGGQAFGGTGVCHQRRRVLPTAHPPLSLSLPPHFLCYHHSLTALEESEAHPLLISKTLPTLFCLAIRTYLIFCAQPASHAAHCSPTDRSFATPPLDLLCILMPQNLPSTPHLPVSCAKPSMLSACHEPCVEVLA